MLLQEVRKFRINRHGRRDKAKVALYYLNNSLQLEMQDPRSEQLNLAGTHLNLTAILTKLGKHTDAITHAKSAIIILRRLIDRKEAVKAQARAKS